LDGLVHIVQEWDERELDPSILWEEFKLHKLDEKLSEKAKVAKAFHMTKASGKIKPPVHKEVVEPLVEHINMQKRLI
jgi:hypothetical protein